MIKALKPFMLSTLISLVIALVTTIIYINLPPFYINSYNISVVPKLEANDANFNYNGFYQSEVSENIVSGLQLFASTNDFKKTVESDVGERLLFLLSRTHGNNIVNVQLVSYKPLNDNAQDVVVQKLQSALISTTPENFEYSVNILSDFSHNYKAGISNTKFFTIVFAVSLIVVSLMFVLNSFYKNE